jgi:hypothetical protein
MVLVVIMSTEFENFQNSTVLILWQAEFSAVCFNQKMAWLIKHVKNLVLILSQALCGKDMQKST